MGFFSKFKKDKKRPRFSDATLMDNHYTSVAMWAATQTDFVATNVDEQREEAERTLDEQAVAEVSEPKVSESPSQPVYGTPSYDSSSSSSSYSDSSSSSDSGSSSSSGGTE